jgi:peptidoglycan/LPS O-acetylase OafA/YrhL
LAVFGWRHFDNGRDAVIGTVGMAVFAMFAASSVALGATTAADSWAGRLLRWGWLRAIGRYSYGMYVMHVLVLHLTDGWGISLRELTRRHSTPTAHAVYLAANFALTLGLAALSFHVLESRLLALKRYFVPGARRVKRDALA